MKKLITVPLLFLLLQASAQMETLFYGQEWSELTKFQDSILQMMPGYKLVERTPSKSGKSETMTFLNGAGMSFKADFLNFKEKIGTVQITGNYEAVMSVYAYYVLKGLVRGKDQFKKCWPVVIKNVNGGKMPISFCKVGSDPDSWTLSNKIPVK